MAGFAKASGGGEVMLVARRLGGPTGGTGRGGRRSNQDRTAQRGDMDARRCERYARMIRRAVYRYRSLPVGLWIIYRSPFIPNPAQSPLRPRAPSRAGHRRRLQRRPQPAAGRRPHSWGKSARSRNPKPSWRLPAGEAPAARRCPPRQRRHRRRRRVECCGPARRRRSPGRRSKRAPLSATHLCLASINRTLATTAAAWWPPGGT